MLTLPPDPELKIAVKGLTPMEQVGTAIDANVAEMRKWSAAKQWFAPGDPAEKKRHSETGARRHLGRLGGPFTCMSGTGGMSGGSEGAQDKKLSFS